MSVHSVDNMGVGVYSSDSVLPIKPNSSSECIGPNPVMHLQSQTHSCSSSTSYWTSQRTLYSQSLSGCLLALHLNMSHIVV